MVGMCAGGLVFLLVPTHPGSPGQRAVKRLCVLCGPDRAIGPEYACRCVRTITYE